MNNEQNIRHFTDLIVWKKSHEFVKLVYKITEHFPPTEQFGLTSQLRRAASSITANIAEGYGRYHYKDKLRFFYQAKGSNTESQNHLILAFDLGYINQEDFNKLKLMVFESYKILWGLISQTADQI